MRSPERLAKRLGINERFIVPGFEDVFYYMWRERKLPVNVDPFDSKLESPEERVRLRRIFESGLKSTVGFALPLQATWESGSAALGEWAVVRARRAHVLDARRLSDGLSLATRFAAMGCTGRSLQHLRARSDGAASSVAHTQTAR